MDIQVAFALQVCLHHMRLGPTSHPRRKQVLKFHIPSWLVVHVVLDACYDFKAALKPVRIGIEQHVRPAVASILTSVHEAMLYIVVARGFTGSTGRSAGGLGKADFAREALLIYVVV